MIQKKRFFLFSMVLNLDPNFMNGHAKALIEKEIENLWPQRIQKLKENLEEAIKNQKFKSIFYTVIDLIELHDIHNNLSKYKGLLRECAIYFLESGDLNQVIEICDFLKKKKYYPQFVEDVTKSINQWEKNDLIYGQALDALNNNRWNVAQKLLRQILKNSFYFVKREIPNSLKGEKISDENSFFLTTIIEKKTNSPIKGVSFISDDEVFFISKAYGCIWNFRKDIILREFLGETSHTYPLPIFDVNKKTDLLVFAEWDVEFEVLSIGGYNYYLVISKYEEDIKTTFLDFPPNTSINCLKLSAEGNFIFGGIEGGLFDVGFPYEIWIWDIESKKVIDKLLGHTDSILALEQISESNLLLSGSNDGIILVWNLNTGRIQKVLSEKTGPFRLLNGKPKEWSNKKRGISQIRYSKSSNLLAACYSDGSVIFWKYPEFEIVLFINSKESGANTLDFSRDGKMLISGGNDGNLKIWQVNTGNLLDTHWGHRTKINCVCFSQSQRYIATGASDGTIRIWGFENR
ncbi:WD40 repeat domain-containing protein [Patescibacteria group bacterium]|nr:WD40 repeat domain-containing protein [Patescibacteria group bacterium]